MSEYNNNGILFKNSRKREGKRDPDYQGEAKTTCERCQHVSTFKLGAWIKDGRRGKFMSIAFGKGTKAAEATRMPAAEGAGEGQPEAEQPRPIF